MPRRKQKKGRQKPPHFNLTEAELRENLTSTGDLVSTEIPELYHYTDLAGTRGILEKNAVWATHFRYLNDTQEIISARHKILPPAIEKAKETFGWWKQDNKFAQALQNNGGYESSVEEQMTKLFDAVFDTTEKLTPPYIASFSHHEQNDEKENGSLDMWRAYSKESDSGYAIVFDTYDLETRIAEEQTKFGHHMLHLQTVEYGDDVGSEDDDLPAIFVTVLNGTMNKLGANVMGPVMEAGNLYKHFPVPLTKHKNSHFRNEHEVRLVVSPITPQSMPTKKHGKARPIFYRSSNDCLIPTVEVFGTDVAHLTIKKIIVGPGVRQEMKASGLRSYLASAGREIDVELSQIPYRAL